MHRLRLLIVLPLLLVSLCTLFPSAALSAEKMSRAERKAQQEAIQKLPEKYKQWLKVVDLLISPQETKTFLELDKDYQRDAFIKHFWEARNPYKVGGRNTFQEAWEAKVEQSLEWFGNLDDERSRILLLNGPPNGRVESQCSNVIWPVEVWFYAHAERIRSEFVVIFYRHWGAGPFRVWSANDGLGALFSEGAGSSGERSLAAIANGCRNGDQIAGGINYVLSQGMGYDILEARLTSKPEDQKGEWVTSFSSYSTDIDPEAKLLPAKLALDFPGRWQGRTAVEGVITVQASGAGQSNLGGTHTFDMILNGEVLQHGQLFENFRYKFDFPASAAPTPADSLPVIFQRYLRPGDYLLVVKLVDLNSNKVFREERQISVPESEKAAPAPLSEDADESSARLLAEANAAIANGDTTVKLIRPFGELQAGMQRFDTLTTGKDIDKVTFVLDGKAVLTKRKPPYSVELDLGNLPRPRTLVAKAYDARGGEVASDEMVVNSAPNRFQVRLVEPRKGKRYSTSLLAKAEPQAPDGGAVERVEFFLNETRVATLYQPPWEQPIVLPKAEALGYVRAVA
ncbi:MAG TPA: GWxTD domain-containing protein, partial [Thermoanaerobaculia bacterium]|nr:GWxTD domain-containing protein [Thermoanaerobaculia bacterium]